jgi:hypothetical protein
MIDKTPHFVNFEGSKKVAFEAQLLPFGVQLNFDNDTFFLRFQALDDFISWYTGNKTNESPKP